MSLDHRTLRARADAKMLHSEVKRKQNESDLDFEERQLTEDIERERAAVERAQQRLRALEDGSAQRVAALRAAEEGHRASDEERRRADEQAARKAAEDAARQKLRQAERDQAEKTRKSIQKKIEDTGYNIKAEKQKIYLLENNLLDHKAAIREYEKTIAVEKNKLLDAEMAYDVGEVSSEDPRYRRMVDALNELKKEFAITEDIYDAIVSRNRDKLNYTLVEIDAPDQIPHIRAKIVARYGSDIKRFVKTLANFEKDLVYFHVTILVRNITEHTRGEGLKSNILEGTNIGYYGNEYITDRLSWDWRSVR